MYMWKYLYTLSCIYSKEHTVFNVYMIIVMRDDRRSSKELSNNISKRRCELKANEPVNERSE